MFPVAVLRADARSRGRPVADTDLLAAADTVAALAYAPYSRFQVGAAVRSASGKVYVAANVENMSYPVGTCAEAAALAAARSTEGDGFVLEAIAISAFDGRGDARPCAPCGACRQRIVEFSGTAKVTFRADRGQLVCETADALLPHRFSFTPPVG